MTRFIFLSLISFNIFAQSPTTTSTTSLSSSLQNLRKAGLRVAADMTSEITRDKKTLDQNGSNHFYDLNTGWKFQDGWSVNLRQEFSWRQADSKEDNWYYDTSEVHLKKDLINNRASRQYLGIQARYLYNADGDLRMKYNTEGQMQLRTYFGAPISGKFFIDRYATYFRLNKHIIREDEVSQKYTRDYEIRLRVSPAYQITSNLKAAVKLEYNYYRMNNEMSKLRQSELVEVEPNMRWSINRRAALSVFATMVPFTSNDNQTFAEDYLDKTTFGLNFAVVLL